MATLLDEKYISPGNKFYRVIFLPIQQMKQCGSLFLSQDVDKLIMLKARAVELVIYHYETQ